MVMMMVVLKIMTMMKKKTECRINPGSGFLCIDATQRIAYQFLRVSLCMCLFVSLCITVYLFICITVYQCKSFYLIVLLYVHKTQYHPEYHCIDE